MNKQEGFEQGLGQEETIEKEAAEREQVLLAEMEALKVKVAEFERNAVIDKALWRAGAKNPIAVRALLNLEKMSMDEMGEIPGLDQAIAEIKEQEEYLFFERMPNRNGLYGFLPAETGRAGQTSADAFAAGFLNV